FPGSGMTPACAPRWGRASPGTLLSAPSRWILRFRLQKRTLTRKRYSGSVSVRDSDMQTLTRLSAAFAIALTALALAAPTVRPAAAQGAGEVPLVVAVLDIQKVMRESTAAKAIQAELEEQRETYQAELAQQERKLRAADQDLAADRPTLSQEAFAERREDLEEQATQLRRDVQTRKEQLEAMYNEGMTQI